MLQNLKRVMQHDVQRYYVTVMRIQTKAKPKVKPLGHDTEALISCKRTEFNLYTPQKEDIKFGALPLASKGWLHHKSKDDHFTINASVSLEALRAGMEDLETLLKHDIKLDPTIIENLTKEMNIHELTAIQVKGIPEIYNKNHALIAAETGCGKTLTYLLPVVQQILELKQRNSKINERKLNTPLTVITTPGRELATQIGSVAEELCKGTDLKVKTILGGNTKQLMLNPDFEDVDILVATMGALSKLVTTGVYRMQEVRHVVLDEADTLLDDTFSDKLCYFLKRFPFHRNHMQDEHNVGTQLILASATMPTNTEELLKRIIDIATLREIVSPNLHKLMPHIEQKFWRMAKANRPANLLSTVKAELSKKRPLIVFSNKSASSDFVSIFLNKSGVNCMNLNGDMLMKIRLGRFEQFQQGACDVLSTTDVASRGLDTTRARHVINFDFPLHVSDYIHRCGRIGRTGNVQKCMVTNFISSRREIDIVQRIEHAARTGGILPNVNANIKNIINQRIMKEMQKAGIAIPETAETMAEEKQPRDIAF